MIAAFVLVAFVAGQDPVEKPAPSSKPPATTQKPSTQKPLPQKPLPQRPRAQKPAAQKPAAQKPAAATDVPSGPAVAITNARILTAADAPIEKGTIVLRGGRIAAVGANVAVPSGARVIDASGKTITPGFVESNTNLGIVEIPLSADGTADQTSTDPGVSAAFNVMDAFNPLSTAIPVARVDGITRALVVPGGTGHVLQGQAAVFDLAGEHVPASVSRPQAAMMAALGEAGAGVAGGSRATAMLRLRELLQDAIDFNTNRAAWQAAQRRDYVRSRLDLEALRPVVTGRMPLAIYANRASDLLAAMRLADEFRLKLVLMGAAEGWMVADELARRKVPVIIKPLTNIPSFDALAATLENAGRLHKAGVTLALSTFDTHRAGTLRQEVGNAISYGLDPDAALRSVTIVPAQLWGISDRAGSLEAGKDADLVIWSGDPFELTTAAEQVFIKGREMPMATRQSELLKKYRTIGR
jgi:imidazolonepropionase-like amidohydrolase